MDLFQKKECKKVENKKMNTIVLLFIHITSCFCKNTGTSINTLFINNDKKTLFSFDKEFDIHIADLRLRFKATSLLPYLLLSPVLFIHIEGSLNTCLLEFISE